MERNQHERLRRDNPIVYMDIRIGDKSVGRMLIELRADVVPRTAENFRRLCTGETKNIYTGKRRHYAHCPFYRVLEHKFCQSGDYLNHDGSGGESTFDQPVDSRDTTLLNLPHQPTMFDDENFILRHTGAGVLSMVNTGPDTNTSQFYLHFGANTEFDNKHVVFGCLLGTESYQVLEAIQNVSTCRGTPKHPVKISACGQVDASLIN